MVYRDTQPFSKYESQLQCFLLARYKTIRGKNGSTNIVLVLDR